MRMRNALFIFAVFILTSVVSWSPSFGQMAGSRGGLNFGSNSMHVMPELTPEAAQCFITIEAKSEVRVKPTEIRIVLALTKEAETSVACRDAIDIQFQTLKASWISEAKIAEADIAEDFIAVLPRYEYEMEQRGGRELAVEKNVGYRMQSNVHLRVDDEEQARKALDVAFKFNVTDIIAFDYGSDRLEASKRNARDLAIKAAKEKSSQLLSVFDETPPVINVQESTVVHYPNTMYESFENTVADSYRSNRSGVAYIQAYRPKNTYFRGTKADVDVGTYEIPMKIELSVVSTVRLYFESPTAKSYQRSERMGVIDKH